MVMADPDQEHPMTEPNGVPTQLTDPADAGNVPADAAMVEEDLLVEEVSIDGMCGVY